MAKEIYVNNDKDILANTEVMQRHGSNQPSHLVGSDWH